MRGTRPRVCQLPGAAASARDGSGTGSHAPAGDDPQCSDQAGQSCGVRESPTAAEGSYGLRPRDLHSAYDLPLPPQPASTQTIAIVDAYNDLGAEADLKVYDEEFRLPECTEVEQMLQEGQPERRNREPTLSPEQSIKNSRRSDMQNSERKSKRSGLQGS